MQAQAGLRAVPDKPTMPYKQALSLLYQQVRRLGLGYDRPSTSSIIAGQQGVAFLSRSRCIPVCPRLSRNGKKRLGTAGTKFSGKHPNSEAGVPVVRQPTKPLAGWLETSSSTVCGMRHWELGASAA